MPKAIDSFYDRETGVHTFLSNFFWHGWTVEHHYQAAKTDDPRWASKILIARTPGMAKKLGRQCPMRKTWEDEKDTVMLTLLRLKFSATDLAEQLLDTGDAELIEGNDWGDTYWGVCNGKGKNMLGKLLMEVRETLSYA